MRVREFVNNQGQKYIVKEDEGGKLNIDFVPFSMRVDDWSFIDDMKAEGKLHYKHEYEVVEE